MSRCPRCLRDGEHSATCYWNHLTKEPSITSFDQRNRGRYRSHVFCRQSCLITGASKGIGKATALRFAQGGANVVINYNSDAKSADALVQQLGGDKALAVQADVSKVAEIEKLVNATVNKFKKIDILVPCAGMLPMSPLEATTEELFDQIFSLNVKGPYFLCQVSIEVGLLQTCTHLLSRKPHRTWQVALTLS